MSSTVTVTEEEVPLTESEKLEKDKKREMETRAKKEENSKRKSKCNALEKLGKAGLVMALGLLGHAVKDSVRLEAEMRKATPPNYVSVPENHVANMTKYIRELEKTNKELVKAQDTLNKLLENNPTSKTQPYSKEVWLKKEIAKASGEEVEQSEEDTSKAVVKSKGRKKGGYFNEHFSLNF